MKNGKDIDNLVFGITVGAGITIFSIFIFHLSSYLLDKKVEARIKFCIERDVDDSIKRKLGN